MSTAEAFLISPQSAVPALPSATARRRKMVLGGALLSGITADLLVHYWAFNGAPALQFLVLLGGVAYVIRDRFGRVPAPLQLLFVLAAAFSLLMLTRDSAAIYALDTLAVLAALGLAASPPVSAGTVHPARVRIQDLIRSAWDTGWYLVAGPFRTGGRTAEPAPEQARSRSLTIGIVRALFFAIAVTTLFALLLSEGDPVFAESLSALTFNPGKLAEHLFVVALVAWPSAGLLSSPSGVSEFAVRVPLPEWKLNRLDIMSVLIAMNVLFALFVLLQLRVLFGGEAYLRATTGLTIAEYARGGFFTLAFTATLTIGLLLTLNALFGRETLASWSVTRRLSMSLLALVSAILVSAVTRMSLYVGAFGLSLDRLTAFVIIAWLGLSCIWFAVTVLRNDEKRFLPGIAIAGATLLLGYNVASPDAIVARNMVARAERGASFDMRYATDFLGADAVPIVVGAISRGAIRPPETSQTGASNTAADQRCWPEIGKYLTRYSETQTAGLNIALHRARRSVAQHRATLEAVHCKVEVARPAA